MVSQLADKVHFLPVDLHTHRSQVTDLNVEYMNWWSRGIEECFKTDLATLLEWSKEAVENKKREYLASEVEKLCSDPHGVYYLLELEGAIIGMGALHQISEKAGEIKRMYIRPAYRGKGYGKALLQLLLKKAKEFGYYLVYLDSGRFMAAAHRLYRSLGFIECNAYPETEIPQQFRTQWLFMKKTLEEPTK